MIKEHLIKEGRDVKIGERYGNIADTFTYLHRVKVYMYDSRKIEIFFKDELDERGSLPTFDAWLHKQQKVIDTWKDGDN